MKRLLCIGVVILMLTAGCGCAKTSVGANSEVTLTFIYGGKDIHTALSDEEAEKVIAILDGNIYDPVSAGVPSCGFDKDISFTVDGRVYAIACDTCNCIQDLGNEKFFTVSEEEIEYIHTLFEHYGGSFPCF